MTGHLRDSDDDIEDYEYPDEDESSEDDDETVPCPHCHKPVYEDAEQCPACGNYLSRASDSRKAPPVWIFIGVTLCFLILLTWIFWI